MEGSAISSTNEKGIFKNSSPKDMLIDFRETGRGEVKEREKYQWVVSHMHPDQGLNPHPFSVQAMFQPSEPPGQGGKGHFDKTQNSARFYLRDL